MTDFINASEEAVPQMEQREATAGHVRLSSVAWRSFPWRCTTPDAAPGELLVSGRLQPTDGFIAARIWQSASFFTPAVNCGYSCPGSVLVFRYEQ